METPSDVSTMVTKDVEAGSVEMLKVVSVILSGGGIEVVVTNNVETG